MPTLWTNSNQAPLAKPDKCGGKKTRIGLFNNLFIEPCRVRVVGQASQKAKSFAGKPGTCFLHSRCRSFGTSSTGKGFL
jgi:hypothetical protein